LISDVWKLFGSADCKLFWYYWGLITMFFTYLGLPGFDVFAVFGIEL
jgi:hypothetical protein